MHDPTDEVSRGDPGPAADRDCPSCGERILAVALKCRYCGKVLDRGAYGVQRQAMLPPTPLYLRPVTPLGCALFHGGLLPGGFLLAVLLAEDLPDELALAMLLCLATAAAGLALLVQGLRTPERFRERRVVTLPGCALCTVLSLLVLSLIAAPFLGHHHHHPSNETAAIGALKTLGTAQALFRETDQEGDGNLDYGTLQELGTAGRTALIDAFLASGTKQGYLFQCSYGASTSEFIWYAVASPALPGTTGDRYFATNHEGVIFYTTQGAFPMNSADCTIPPGALPVGR